MKVKISELDLDLSTQTNLKSIMLSKKEYTQQPENYCFCSGKREKELRKNIIWLQLYGFLFYFPKKNDVKEI